MRTLKISLLVFILSITISAQWYVQNSGTTNHLYGVEFVDSINGWIVGSQGTILQTTDGGNNWTIQTSGTSEFLWDINFTDFNNGTIVGGLLGTGLILRTTNGGTNWNVQSDSTTKRLYAVDFTDENTGIAVGELGTIYKTTNGGTSWIQQTSGTMDWFYSVSFVDQNIGIAVGGAGTIIKTTDGGINWIFLDSAATGTGLSDIHFIDANTAIAVGPSGTIIRTIDGGINWTQQSATQDNLFGVFFTDANIGTAVGGFIPGYFPCRILRTTNGGTIWTQQETPPFNENLFDVFFFNTDIGTVVGASGIIFRTTNGGVTFIESNSVLSEEFSLFQNYPNPFNPVTKIKYKIPALPTGQAGSLNPSNGGTLVQLVVYDILGREVAVLVNEEKQSGEYELEFNGSNLSSGVYLYRLTAGEFSDTKKLVLLK